MTKSYNKRATEAAYKIGSKVWLTIYVFPKSQNKNFKIGRCGPMYVIGKDGDYNYKLRHFETGQILPNSYHANRLSPYYDRVNIADPVPNITLKESDKETEQKLSEMLTQTCGEVTKIILNDCDDVTAPDNEDTGAQSNDPLIVINDREIHAVPKARKLRDGSFQYYIIYKNQPNLNIGVYIDESKLSSTEKEFIEQNKSSIKIMRHMPKDIV
jgi:hypothetical protein